MEQSIDILNIFENTKKELQGTQDKVSGKLEMLNEIIDFFKAQNLRVLKDVEKDSEPENEEAAPAVESTTLNDEANA